MKMHIEGDMNKEDIIKLGKFLKEQFVKREEHINVFIEQGCDGMSSEEVSKMMLKIFDKDTDNLKIFKLLMKDKENNGK